VIPRPIAVLFGFLALFHWASLATAQAQGQGDHRLVLKGYDPVAYFTDGKPTPGKPEYETVFDESRYRFSSTGNQSLFLGNPEKYAPQFAGACTNGLAQGVKVEADPTLWRIVDGKLFVFTGQSVPGEMDSDPKRLIAQASENWKTLAHQPFAAGSH
jgi:YHS domain-containing protein